MRKLFVFGTIGLAISGPLAQGACAETAPDADRCGAIGEVGDGLSRLAVASGSTAGATFTVNDPNLGADYEAVAPLGARRLRYVIKELPNPPARKG
jgi:hypothetical protein